VEELESVRLVDLEGYSQEEAAERMEISRATLQRTLYEARRKIAEKTTAEARLVKAGKEYARLARLQYDGGYAPYFTVLQAQQQLFPAELTYALSRASLLNSLVDIYKAMGGGWITEADQMTATSD